MPIIIDNFEITPEAPPPLPKTPGAKPPPPDTPATPQEIVRVWRWQAERMRRVHAD